MKNIMRKAAVVLVCLILCLSFATSVSAVKAPEVVLSLDKTQLTVGEIPSTITLTVKTDSAQTLAALSGEVYTSSTAITINEIRDGDKELTASAQTGRFAWMNANGKSVTTWAYIDISLPADLPVGEYTIGVRSLSAKDTANNQLLETFEKTITFSVKEKALLTGISVTAAPAKTAYYVGDNFDKTGMTVKATYSDSTQKTITSYTVTDGTALTLGKTSVTISYTEGGVTKTAKQTISVTAKPVVLSYIKITKDPDKVIYKAGENFDATGMTVTAVYSDSSEKVVSSYTVNDGKALAAGKNTVTISYTDGGITKTAMATIAVVSDSVTLTKVEFTSPDKTSYYVGQDFIQTGMKATLTYSDGKVLTVSEFTVENGTKLALGTKSVTVKFTAGGIEFTYPVNITVTESPADPTDDPGTTEKKLVSVYLAAQPSKVFYNAGEDFSTDGIELRAVYSDGTEATVTDYTVIGGEDMTEGKTAVGLSYTEDGVTKTVSVQVLVYDNAEGTAFPWWIIAVAILAAGCIVIVVVVTKRKD